MKQNTYDDPSFFANYSQMPRSVGGLESAGDWPAFRVLLPDLRDKRVLDLECGFGWHCRYARGQGARFVVGVDLSEKMLARAKADTEDRAIEYRRSTIEELDFDAGQFDVVISSLALHYVKRFDVVCRNVSAWLTAGGAFVFWVEHPVFTAIAAQQWCLGPTGERLHWPLDDYHEEGARHTKWMADDVVKYHRTTATYVNASTPDCASPSCSNRRPRRRCWCSGQNGTTSAGARCLYSSRQQRPRPFRRIATSKSPTDRCKRGTQGKKMLKK